MSKDSSSRYKKAVPPRKAAKAEEFLVKRPPPSPYYDFESLSFLPKHVTAAAQKLQQGRLKGEVIEERFAADDPSIVHFLTTLTKSGEQAALTHIAGLLRCYPMLLNHPYIWDTVRRLYYGATPHDDLHNFIQDWLVELVKAWVEGITLGALSIKKVGSPKRGRPRQLFPHLREMEGWLPTQAASSDQRQARDLMGAYLDLHERLRHLDDWKAQSAEFRQNPDSVVSERALDVEKVFDKFKSERGFEGSALSEMDFKKIVRTGFNEVYKGHSPRHEITCQLLATLSHRMPDGTLKTITPVQVHKHLETLRKFFGKEWFEDWRVVRGLPTKSRQYLQESKRDQFHYQEYTKKPPAKRAPRRR